MTTNSTLETKLKVYGGSFPFVRFPPKLIRELLVGEMAPRDSLVGRLLVSVGRGFEEFTNAWFVCDPTGDQTKKTLSRFSDEKTMSKDLLWIAECNELPFFVETTEERANVWYPGDNGELRRQHTLVEMIRSFEHFDAPNGIPHEEARNEWFRQHIWEPKRNERIFDVRRYSDEFEAWLDDGLPTFPPPNFDFGFSRYVESLSEDVIRKVFSDKC